MVRASSHSFAPSACARCALRAVLVAALALLFIAGCSRSSQPQPSDVHAKTIPAEPATAKNALGPLYTVARQWSSDALLLRMTAKTLPGYDNQGGTAALWEASFGSPSHHTCKIFRYSIANVAPDIYKGVQGGKEATWGGVTPEIQPVSFYTFNTDSDAAFRTAAASAASWMKKHPGEPLHQFEIGNNGKYPGATWFLTWGDQKSGYVAVVDVTTGKLIRRR